MIDFYALCDPLPERHGLIPEAEALSEAVLEPKPLSVITLVIRIILYLVIALISPVYLMITTFDQTFPTFLRHGQLVAISVVGLIIIPISVLAIINIIVPKKLLFTNNGVLHRNFGRWTAIPWSNIIELQLKPNKINIFGGTRDFITIKGLYGNRISLLPYVYGIDPQSLFSYIVDRRNREHLAQNFVGVPNWPELITTKLLPMHRSQIEKKKIVRSVLLNIGFWILVISIILTRWIF